MIKRPTFNFDKDLFKRSVEYNVRTMYRRTMKEATDQQVFQASAMALKDQIIDCWMRTQVVYLSMEFLMGRAFGNDAINLMAYEPIKQALKELGFKLDAIEDQEPDAALGNGGLGRLAACTSTVCSSRRSETAIRWKFRTTGWRTATLWN